MRIHFDEMVDFPFPGGEPFPQGDHETPKAVGYVCAVDREAGTVQISREQVEQAIGDPTFPHLLYALCVLQGTQREVHEIWPDYFARKSAADHVASHFYASSPPDR